MMRQYNTITGMLTLEDLAPCKEDETGDLRVQISKLHSGILGSYDITQESVGYIHHSKYRWFLIISLSPLHLFESFIKLHHDNLEPIR